MRVGSAEFRRYAERVFRLQNEVATSIALLLDSEPFDDEALASLERMEENLYEACGLLNDVAIRRRDGGGVRWLADAKAARSVPGCELAASNAREALADASR